MFLLLDIYNMLNDNEEVLCKRFLCCLCGKYICFFDRYVDWCFFNENLVLSVLILKFSWEFGFLCKYVDYINNFLNEYLRS